LALAIAALPKVAGCFAALEPAAQPPTANVVFKNIVTTVSIRLRKKLATDAMCEISWLLPGGVPGRDVPLGYFDVVRYENSSVTLTLIPAAVASSMQTDPAAYRNLDHHIRRSTMANRRLASLRVPSVS